MKKQFGITTTRIGTLISPSLGMTKTITFTPSLTDVLAIFGTFQFDWRYSFYQIGLTLLSVATVIDEFTSKEKDFFFK